MSILNILNALAATSSRLDKEAILKREIDNALLQTVIFQALNPYINYYIKKIPAYTPAMNNQADSLDSVISSLEMISSRQVTGNAAIEYLTKLLSSLVYEDGQVLERIIGRDLKCGVDAKTVNKIWSGIVPTFDVMLAHKDVSGIKYPCFAQTKMDGARCHLVWDGHNATAFARSGKEFHLHGALNESASFWMKPNETFDGELLFVDDNGKFLDRKTSNGLANKANKGTLSEEESKRVRFVVWDIVDFSSKIPYENRFKTLNTLYHRTKLVSQTKIQLVNSVVVNDEVAAMAFYQEQIANGEEGAILKNSDLKWEPKRSKGMGKIKAEEEADLLVVGFNWGSGKYAEKLGSLICQTADGKLEVAVSGMDEETRFMHDDPHKWIGNIITVKYNAIINDKKSAKYSLFLPRYVETRFDKTVANKFEDLK